MIRFLLDANVLIALMDPAHIRHEDAHRWFELRGSLAWATCPLTQNAVLRILGSSKYPNSPGTPSAVAELLRSFCSLRGHRFWADSISLLDRKLVLTDRILHPAQVTDSYLLALAAANKGKLATFDRRILDDAVADTGQWVEQIG